MKRKIFLYYLILTVIGVSVTGFFISQLAQRFYKLEVKERLKSTALLIEHQILEQAANDIRVDYDRIAKKCASILNSFPSSLPEEQLTRITFIDFSGNVLGETDTDRQSMENHLDRKEVQEAIKGKLGEDTRFSHTLRMDFLYIAVPIKNLEVIARVSVPLRMLKRIDQIIWGFTVAGILAGLILSALLAWRFSVNMTRPINELIQVSREIAEGNYSKRVNITSADEIGELSETFNEMTEKLEKTVADLLDKNIKVDSIIDSMTSGIVAVDRNYRIILINSIASEMFGLKYGPGIIGMNILELIRNSHINSFLNETIGENISLVNDITVGSPYEKVLRIHTNPIKSKDGSSPNSGGMVFMQDITNIRKLEQIRTEFVSNVTHELKTPLTSIRGFIETLRGGAINDRDVAERFLEIIDIEAERLAMLINDILQLSEIENRQKDSNIGTYNLKSIIDEIMTILEGVAEKKGVKLYSEVDGDIKIHVNRNRVKQMLINLVENGIKYNKDSGSVHISAYRGAGNISIIVRDTGIGIAEEHLPRIFERFYRVDKGRSRSMGGTGLGLSIVKHIVNLYSGDIKVNSEPGKGTEFIIRLPA